jgi:YfiH family protein
VIRWDAPGPYAVAFTTREGGVSEGPYASLNLGLLTPDDPERVEENRRLACAALGAEAARLALNYQQHGSQVLRAGPGVRGRPADALWTDEPALPVLALGADCLPLALVRTAGTPAVAVVHAGWRGLLAGVVERAVATLGGPLAAAVGPAIGACCYEVGPEVREPLAARYGAGAVRGRHADLRAAAERALRDAGVERVEHVDHCTRATRGSSPTAATRA